MEIFLLCNLQQTITLPLLQRYSNFPSPGSVLEMSGCVFAKQTWCKENRKLDNSEKGKVWIDVFVQNIKT